MTTDQLFEKLSAYINNKILPNPSKQNQMSDHFFPYLASTLFLLTLPYGRWIGLVVPLVGIYKELVEDGHWKDIWKFDETNKTSPFGGADGRCDLFFRLLGCGLGYLTLFWK